MVHGGTPYHPLPHGMIILTLTHSAFEGYENIISCASTEYVPYIGREEVVGCHVPHSTASMLGGAQMSTEASTSHALAESLHIECDSVVDMLPEDLFFSPSQHFPILSPS